jgi:hypothetical protein
MLFLFHESSTNKFNLNRNKMKTLTLSAKAGGRNYFFGQPSRNGQEQVKVFQSAEELHAFMSARTNGYYLNCSYIHKVINTEYSRSATFYSRNQFDKIEFCRRVFEKHATIK